MHEDFTSIDQFNKHLTEKIVATKESIEQQRILRWYTPKSDYLFFQLASKLQSLIDTFLGENYTEITPLPCLIHWIDKGTYGADFTIKFDTTIVRTLWKLFASEFVPQVVNLLTANQTTLRLVTIEQKGIYINGTLEDGFWGDLGEQILTLGDAYGDLDNYQGQTAIAEYSSPNAAKHLHAGHVRSTVIGYVLSNIYEHAGYTVHRINHINDRGGFGQLIEGRKRWHDILYAKWLRNNDLNYEIYTIWRYAEPLYKGIKSDWVLNQLRSSWVDKYSYVQDYNLDKYFDTSSEDAFVKDYESFQANSIAAFHALEAGDSDIFIVRKEIVNSSMVEFKEFYDKLWTSHDYTIGESFYEKIGRQCIEEGKKSGDIVTFTQDFADQYVKKFDKEFTEFKWVFDKNDIDIYQEQRNKKYTEMSADINAEVVLLDNRERFVVLRSDGGSIYATRDIWCLWFRTETRAPSLIMYEVGQEQEDHFQKLFETGEKLGRLTKKDGTKTQCLHIAHGFYVDASTKKKLSSRAGASNVHALIDATIAYFKEKYADSTDFTPEEIDHNARTLGIASIIINDLSKNRMDPVLVDPDLTKTIQWFEQSGGAYLIYTVCRAKSLLRKATVSFDQKFTDLQQAGRTQQQIGLLQQLSELPTMLEKATIQHEPSLLVNYAYQLTQSFNTMYWATDRMIDDAVALKLTTCYIQVMTNVLRICNIEPLERM